MLSNNELYVLYFVPILHSDTSMFVYIEGDEFITTIFVLNVFYIVSSQD